MRAVVLLSGRGSNFEALLAARLPLQYPLVLSNNPEARGIDLARRHGIPATVLNHREFSDRAAFDAALAAEIDRHAPDLVILAGFMRVLGEGFVRRYHGRMLNIHPSLLPMFPGLHTHRRAIEAGVRVHGCTVHFVTPEVDGGPIIVQAAVPVLPDDDEERLAARVLAQEHRIYPLAVRWFAEGRLRLDASGRAVLNDWPWAAQDCLISPPAALPQAG